MQLGVGLHDLFVEVDGGSGQRAVFGNLRAEHIPDASIHILLQEGQQILGGIFLPTVDADLPKSHVGPEDHPIGTVFLQPTHEEIGLGDGYGTHSHHSGS